jgi:hypothetical protein
MFARHQLFMLSLSDKIAARLLLVIATGNCLISDKSCDKMDGVALEAVAHCTAGGVGSGQNSRRHHMSTRVASARGLHILFQFLQHPA